MHLILLTIAGAVGVPGVVCWFLLLIDAFQNQIWKGAAGLWFGPYLLYYGIFEFKAEDKWFVVIMAFAGTSLAVFLVFADFFRRFSIL
ncbi:MAG TPA: hypothetical protein VGL56_02185 [Fimbriimonadaceae bacterium]|jgi:hypothetical protein